MKLLATTLCGLASAGCSSNPKAKNPLECVNECDFQNVGRTLRRTFYSHNSWTYFVVGTEANADAATGSYKDLLTFDGKNCKQGILEALEAREFGIEVMDKSQAMMSLETLYLGQPDKCWPSKKGLFMQINKDATKVSANKFDLMNKKRTKDFYYLQFLGINRAINQLGFTEDELHQCLGKANVKRLLTHEYGKDHTKCLSYKLCEKEWDDDDDDVVTTTQTTKTTKPTEGPTSGPTVDPNPDDLPDYNDYNYDFSCTGSTCTIEMENGISFQGTEKDGVVSFNMVPYAEPPVADLRWKSPVLKLNYDGLVDANISSKKCMTLSNDDWSASSDVSEDCLYLKIQVAKTVLEQKEKRPIVYYIHGGGFNGGTGQGDRKKAVLNQDVVAVGVNYRLGPWGFLQLNELEEGQTWRGSWGLQDQVAGMKWMNVFGGIFGGDPNNLTLIGGSAGSESCWRHFTTPYAWPYFTRIAATGIGLVAGSKGDGRANKKLTNAVFTEAGCSENDMACLRSLSTQEIQTACDDATRVNRNDNVAMVLNSGFSPVHTSDYFTSSLVNDIANGNYKPNTDLLWTYSKDEAWGMTAGFFMQNINMPGTFFNEWKDEINADKTSSGHKVPSPWPEKLFEKLFPNHADALKETFGCGPSNCEEEFTKFVVATQWVCSTRWALKSSWSPSSNLFAVQYEEPNCDGGTKACHGAEGSAVLGGLSGRGTFGDRVTKAYKEFFHSGSTNELTESSQSLLTNFNRISEDNWSTEDIGETMYNCDLLDQLQNEFNWYNWGINDVDGYSLVENTNE